MKKREKSQPNFCSPSLHIQATASQTIKASPDVLAAFDPSIDSASFYSSMPSRKKAKGKARRAAKGAKAVAVEEDEEQAALVANQDGSLEAQMQRLTIDDLLRESSVQVQCLHGLELESGEEELCIARSWRHFARDVLMDNETVKAHYLQHWKQRKRNLHLCGRTKQR